MKSLKEILIPSEIVNYPSITIRKAVFFPGDKVPLVVEGKEFVQTLNNALAADQKVVVLFQKNGEASHIGVLVKIIRHWDIMNFMMGLSVEGLMRVKVKRTYFEEGVQKSEIEQIAKEDAGDGAVLEALSRSVHEQLTQIIQIEGVIPLSMSEDLQKEHLSPERTADIATSVLKLSFKEKLEFLEMTNVQKRLEKIGAELAREIRIVETEKMIQKKTAKEISQAQKEVILRQQLKTIEKELGIGEGEKVYAELESKIKKMNFPVFVAERALKELSRLRTMYAGSAEAPYIRTYLDWIMDLPWTKKTGGEVDLKKAVKALDEDHYGLEKAKERVLDFLAVQKLTKGKSHGNIICFVGPPGTGKTSVGKSIARTLGREFVRISLGGVRDEAEIRGHRRTYIGALPGRIIQAMKTAGTKNPVFMLDEIDKLGADFMGNPEAALLEVLDPEQNNAFVDHYLELPYDLSEVFFITTANVLDPIMPALRDRLEVIEFPGYTMDEKFQIAKKFLIPRVLTEHGLSEKKLEIKDDAISKIISRHTREAGVRELERKFKEIARKTARKIAEKDDKEKTVVTEDNLGKFIGFEEFEVAIKGVKNEVGVATGLAWTPVGGEIIFVETALVPGKGKLILTGQLGEVMKESAKAALSYIRSKSHELHFDPLFYADSDIHIHVPSGAIPKDGPSAGIAIAVAIASAVTKREIKKDIALTGEITLSGKILKIGGVKEKVLAAHRAGVKIVIMPKSNEKSLDDVPDSIKKELEFRFVERIGEVLEMALVK